MDASDALTMFGFFKKRRRERLRAAPFPPQFVTILTANVPVYRRLPADLRAQLHGHINVLLAEKHFEGCNGLEMTDEVRVTVAGEAALLILNRETDYYPELVTILVYPSVFYAEVEAGDGFIVSEYTEDRSGESWDLGVVILSWEDAVEHASTGRAGYNVVLHEFAHQLDSENGAMDGFPRLRSRAERDAWHRAFTAAYERFESGGGRGSVVDEYGAGDPSEFFAVVTESFFERPLALRREQPALYEVLSR
ncbi:MAG TPA: M90 family metallopeptidase, partial [Candidatus Krumholzibacteria bacterium]|nr:M90 family metallopeptidase [Candidatus Krumholzibacteria bacterium]